MQFSTAVVWVDALHHGYFSTFSPVSFAQWEQIRSGAALPEPDVLLFTHLHPDHFSKEMTEEILKKYPRAKLLSVTGVFNTEEILLPQTKRIVEKEIIFDFFPLQHEGAEFRNTPNYGCIIDYYGFKSLILGDCAVANPQLNNVLRGTQFDVAFLNFPWITLTRGRLYLKEHLKCRHMLIYHLPFVQEDDSHYQLSTVKAAQWMSPYFDVRLLKEPFQTITLE